MIASPSRFSSRIAAAIALVVAGTAVSQPPPPPLPPPDEQPPAKAEPPQTMDLPLPNPKPGVRVADRGPIHEAFAQPGADVRGKEITAPKAPPPPINEVPPDAKPEGANVKWIPGYWAWDANKNDFIWVSGFYRNVPPNRSWEAGKWIVKDGKNVYIPGYWRPSAPSELPNLPEPPKTLENGPSTPNANPDAMWVPGSWDYRNGEFAWRAGYWASPYRQMMWQPPQYVYNGSDYTYVPGYWDYPLEERGLLNAPVYIDPQVYQNPNFTFTPQYGLNVGDASGWGNGGLFGSMFIGPNYNNYYYGNPYGGGAVGYDPGLGGGLGGLGGGLGYGDPGLGGFAPWFFGGPGFYNPLWNHYGWLNRGNPNWGNNYRNGRYGQGGGRGVVSASGARGTAGTHGTTGPRSAGSAAGIAGAAAQATARSALDARSTQMVRPANQVLANQSVRSVNPGVGIRSGAYTGSGVSSGGVTIRPGTSSSYYGSGGFVPGGSFGSGYGSGYRSAEPIFRGSTGSFGGGGYYRGGSAYSGGGARFGGGGGRGGGGHR